MLIGGLAALVLAPAAAFAGSAHPQLYLSPAPARLTSSRSSLELDAPQTHAVLASHLGVAHHLPLPASHRGSSDWEAALDRGDPLSGLARSVDHPRIVLVLECPKSGCTDALPVELVTAHPPLQLPALPAHAYLAALALHLHRLADSLSVDPATVHGLTDLVNNGVKSVAGWQGYIGDQLAGWIGYSDVNRKVRPAVEPHTKAAGLVDDLDFLDASSSQLILELERIAALADGTVSTDHEADSGPQGAGEVPKVVVVHLKGLQAVAAKHPLSSPTYQRATLLLRETLTGLLASLRARLAAQGAEEPSIVLLTLPPHAQPLLRKREPWLKPFEARSGARYGAPSSGRALNGAGAASERRRRSVFSPRADAAKEGDEPTLVVPAGKTCFPSLSALQNATASCLGRGDGVRGISTRAGGAEGECWVCKCRVTEDDKGRRMRWAGEGCEKADLSGSAVLLAGTTVLLALLVAGSVALLYNIGDVPLPGTLSAVSGMAGHAKRD